MGIFTGLFDSEDKTNARKIGEEIWRQVGDAMREDLETFNDFIQTPFVAGYTYGFIRFGFSSLGYGHRSEKMSDKWFNYILYSILDDGKFKRIIKNQIQFLENTKSLGSEKPTEQFTKGGTVGAYDAGMKFVDLSLEESLVPLNLQRYLLNQELEYRDILG